VAPLRDPVTQFTVGDPRRLAISLPKWAKTCGWGHREDNMLALGCYWHGFGSWDRIAGEFTCTVLYNTYELLL
jgi:hypothetical protein